MSELLDSAIEEINRVLIGNKDRNTEEVYLKNAIRYIREYGSQPQINDNQQIVLEHLKSMSPPKLGVSAMVTAYCLVDDNINDNWQEYSEEIPEHIEALQKLNIAEENQVLEIFSQWALEQEEE